MGKERWWGWIEAALVVQAWVEVIVPIVFRTDPTELFSLVRFVRLIRITRIIRVMRLQIFGDLLMMIRGAVGGVRTLFWSAVLISFPVYAMALVMRETVGNTQTPGEGGVLFKTVGQSFVTVFRCIVASDCTEVEGKPIFMLIS